VLHPGDRIPHFTVSAIGGDPVRYADIWQRRNLVLVTVEDASAGTDCAAALAARASDFRDLQAACVVTTDRVNGFPTPGAIVADRWGEVVHVAAPNDVGGLPTPVELIEWLDYVARRCPECEGESR
jgi:hypothetical protein